jgi:benzylsuccinate CoA-transferase BbsF subunit
VLLGLVEEWTRTRSVMELFHEGQQLRIAFAPVFGMDDLAGQEHLRSRGFFVDVEHPVAGRLIHLGAPARLAAGGGAVPGPAPRLGEHTGSGFRSRGGSGESVDNSVAGSRSDSTSIRRDSGRIDSGRIDSGRIDSGRIDGGRIDGGSDSRRPLEGVRILDFSWVWAGPFATLQLAHLGADVIKIESPQRSCLGRRLPFHPPGIEPTLDTSGYFNQWNQGKRSVALDLTEPRGVDLARRLAARCDVVLDNFAVGVMERLGLGYEDLRALRPDIIVAQISGYGQDGPYKRYMAYGPTTAPLSGLSSLTAYPDDGRPRELGIAFGDPAAGIQAALHVVAALVHRRATGEGSHIDVSLWEATAVNAVEGWMATQVTGHPPAPLGNRDDRWAPHNCYRCTGPDDWVTIACTTDDEWRALAAVMDRAADPADPTADPAGPTADPADPAIDPRFVTGETRKAHEDALDSLVAAWTATRDKWDVTRRLQARGVPAFPSLSPRELAHDPHLADRGFLERLEHPVVGRRLHAGIPWLMADSPNGVRHAAPTMGQHSEEVLRELLGLDADEVAALRANGVLAR